MFVRRRNRRVSDLAGKYGRVICEHRAWTAGRQLYGHHHRARQPVASPQPIAVGLVARSLAVRYAYCHANAHCLSYTVTFGHADRYALALSFGNPERHPVADQAPRAAPEQPGPADPGQAHSAVGADDSSPGPRTGPRRALARAQQPDQPADR